MAAKNIFKSIAVSSAMLFTIISLVQKSQARMLPASAPSQKADTTYAVSSVDMIPMFPGGVVRLQQFLSKYALPQEAKDNHISGILYVQFVVATDGSLTDIKVLRDLKYGTSEEAVRLLNSSPKWTPGIKNGRPVRVTMTQPIRISPVAVKTGEDANANIIILPAGSRSQVPQPAMTADSPPVSDEVVQVHPGFPGGEISFAKFLQKYEYPEAALKDGVSGKIIMQFIVEKDGSLSDIKVLRDLGPGTGEQAIKLMKNSPKWRPGIQNGRPVRVVMTIPVLISPNKS